MLRDLCHFLHLSRSCHHFRHPPSMRYNYITRYNYIKILIYNVISKPPSRRFHLCRHFLRCRRNDSCHIFHISHCHRRSPRGRYTQSAKCVKVMLFYKNKILSHFFHSPLIATLPVFATFSIAPVVTALTTVATFATLSTFPAVAAGRLFLRCRRNDPCHIFHIPHCRRRSPQLGNSLPNIL